MRLQTGDIVLFRTPFKWYNPISYLGAAIRFFTKYPYNHVGVVVSNWGKLFINEAIEKGVISIPVENRFKGEDVLILRDPIGIDEEVFARRANSFLGNTGYDFTSLLMFQLIFQVTKTWIGRTQEKAKKRMYCSEYVAYLYGINNWWRVSPDRINNGGTFNVVFEGNNKELLK